MNARGFEGTLVAGRTALRRTGHVGAAVVGVVFAGLGLLLGPQACGGSNIGGSAADAGSDARGDEQDPNTPCAKMGGTCMPGRPENFTCGESPGTSGQPKEVRDPSLCDQGQPLSILQLCCVPGSGNVPALNGYVDCGSTICPPGSTCKYGTDQTTCLLSDGGGG